MSVDCGVKYKGYHSDSAYTYPLEGVTQPVLDLLNRTYDSLYLGIEQAKAGNRIGDIGYAIQSYVEKFGYGVVRELVGHGVGKNLHEDPEVPNYGMKGKGLKIVAGMVFAIEPMINLGTRNVVQEADGLDHPHPRQATVGTLRTYGRRCTTRKTEVLTTHKYIEEAYSYKWRNKSQ